MIIMNQRSVKIEYKTRTEPPLLFLSNEPTSCCQSLAALLALAAIAEIKVNVMEERNIIHQPYEN